MLPTAESVKPLTVEAFDASRAVDSTGAMAIAAQSQGAGDNGGGGVQFDMQALLEEIDERLEEKLVEFLGEKGTRAPEGAKDLADTIGDMEGHGMSDAHVQEARDIFDLYDSDCSGTIDAKEMMDVLRMLGEDPTEEEVIALIAEVDENENGDLTLNEFLQIFSRVNYEEELEEHEAEIEAAHAGAKMVEERKKQKRKKKSKPHRIDEISFYGVQALMRWISEDGDKVGGDVTGPEVPAYRRMARLTILRRDVETVFYMCILLSAINSGLQTYPDLEFTAVVVWLGRFTNVMFVVEVFIKLIAETGSCGALMGFFSDAWNLFDVAVLCALVVLTPLATGAGGMGAVRVLRILRLLRALRILRAAKVFPQLTLVLETLIRSFTSVIYVLSFMLLISYIFAIVAVTIFGANDPFSFGTLGRAMTTLFRIATLEGWTPIMYTQIYGCKGYGDGLETYLSTAADFVLDCADEAHTYFGRFFFMMYIGITSYMLLNLFIGVIVSSMMEMKRETEEKLEEAKAWAVATRLKEQSHAQGKKSTRNLLAETEGEDSKDSGGSSVFSKRRKKRANEVEFENPVIGAEG